MEIMWTILFVVVSVIFLYVFFRTLRSLLLWIKARGVLEGRSPLKQFFPLPLIKGKGIKGMGSPNKNPLVNDLLEIL